MTPTRKAHAMIFRNLTRSCFSIRLRGKVVEDFTDSRLFVGRFHVLAGGRAQVIKHQKKFVHAFVKTTAKQNGDTGYVPFDPAQWENFTMREVTYNPYKNETFVYKDTGEVASGALIVMQYPKVYVLE